LAGEADKNQREAEQAASNEAIRSDEKQLQGWYKTQATMADVAAFMHEVELEMGMMPQG